MNKETLAEIALKYLGAPSIRYCGPEHGKSPEGFDCSGFIDFCLNELSFPYDKTIRHCNEFFDSFGILVHEDCISCGDLVFFSRDGFRPTHVGIMLDKETYIHSPGTSNSIVSVSEISKEPIVTKRTDHSVIYSHNPIGYKRLVFSNSRWKTLLP
ncbi:MAG: NlpC/P60 family protein [Candidatus Paceibacterota bacterium]